MSTNYSVGTAIKANAPHHESFQALWETKWKKPCEMGLYPFMFGAVEDFQPVIDELIAKDMKEPYDWDNYAQTFFPYAERLLSKASECEASGDIASASELYMRASALFRIARFPISRSGIQREAWDRNKAAALKGLSLRSPRFRDVVVPYKYAIAGEGKEIHIYHDLPACASASNPVPHVIIFTGLDGYRTDLAVWIPGWLARNIGVIIVEIPGTGDSPALASDPKSPDRLWSSLFDWCDAEAEINSKSLVVWGFSTGGYYAIRVAHTHADKLKGAITLGGGCHYMFDKQWLDEVNHLEYPFDLAGALAVKFGFASTPEGIEALKKEGMAKFSLLEDGTLDGPNCTRLLVVNGILDEIFPMEDSELLLRHGGPKEVRLVEGRKHMGEPESFGIVLKWIYDLLGVDGVPGEQLKTLPFKAKVHLEEKLCPAN